MIPRSVHRFKLANISNQPRSFLWKPQRHNAIHSIEHTSKNEGQATPRDRQKNYYPALIGSVYHSRYRIIEKLGLGAYSSVWLAEDQRSVEITQLYCVKLTLVKTRQIGRPQNLHSRRFAKFASAQRGQDVTEAW